MMNILYRASVFERRLTTVAALGSTPERDSVSFIIRYKGHYNGDLYGSKQSVGAWFYVTNR